MEEKTELLCADLDRSKQCEQRMLYVTYIYIFEYCRYSNMQSTEIEIENNLSSNVP